jgi:hypothetical protein
MFRFFCCAQDEEKSVDTGPKFFSQYTLAETIIQLTQLHAQAMTTAPSPKALSQSPKHLIEPEDFDKGWGANPKGAPSVFTK